MLNSKKLPKVASTPALSSQAVPKFPPTGSPESSAGFSRASLQRSQSTAERHVLHSAQTSSFQSSARSWRSSATQSLLSTSQSMFGKSKLPPLPKQPLSFEELYESAKERARKKSVQLREVQMSCKRKRGFPMINNKVKQAFGVQMPDGNYAAGRDMIRSVRLPEAVERRGTPQGNRESSQGLEIWDPLRALMLETLAHTDVDTVNVEESKEPDAQQEHKEVRITSAPRQSSVEALPTLHESANSADKQEELKKPRKSRKSLAARKTLSSRRTVTAHEMKMPFFRLPFNRADSTALWIARARRTDAEEQKCLKCVYQRYAPGEQGEIDVEQLPEILDYLSFLAMEVETVKEVVAASTTYSTLNFSEFEDLVEKFRERENRMLQEEFDKLDKSRSGSVATEELNLLMKDVGVVPSRVILQEAMEVVDTDNRGIIKMDEFEKLMAVHRVTEGFSRTEVVDLQRIFERFSTTATDGIAGIILRVEDLSAALKHMFGPQATEQAQSLAAQTAQLVPGRARAASPAADKVQPLLTKSTSILLSVSDEGLSFSEFLLWARRLREMELEEYRDKFEDYAEDRSGRLEVTELQGVIASLGYVPLRQAVQDALQEVGHEEKDSLDFDEFFELMVHWRTIDGFSREEVAELSNVWSIFGAADSGEMECLKLMDMLRHLGHIITFNELQRMVHEIDYNNTNFIDFREFLRLMRIFQEKELSRLRRSFDMNKNDVNALPASKIRKVLGSIGYKLKDDEVRSILEDAGNPATFDFDGCVEFVDLARQACLAPRRKVAGYADEEIERFQTAFETYDEDKNGTIEKRELEKLLRDLKIVLRTVGEQKELLDRIDIARHKARKAGVEEELIGEMGKPFITFHTLLHFLRQLHNEDDRKEVDTEGRVVQECKFTSHEVAEFRHVFENLATVSGMAAKVSTSKRESTLLSKSISRVNNVDPAGEYLSDESAVRVLARLGLQLNHSQREQLDKKLKSYHVDTRPGLDFPDFLRFMRWMLDTNFANINGREGM